MAKKTEKLIVLGIDGMDPRFTKYMLDKGEMPALKEFVARGGCREDLVMLGGMPTITPPMWTTLSTGAQASTHGITGFWNVDPNDRSKLVYALDSTICKAEQVWNCLVEAGNKVLLWHWPGLFVASNQRKSEFSSRRRRTAGIYQLWHGDAR